MPTGICHHCGLEFKRDADQLRRAKFSFCSVDCKRANPDFRTYAASQNGDKQRDRGAGVSYRKRNGRHEHRVVMEQTIGRPLRPGEIVHHRDGNKRNNDPANLELMTQSEHMTRHAEDLRAAKKNPARGSRIGMAKLTEQSVVAIRLAGFFQMPVAVIAKHWRVSKSTVQRILARKAWCHV